AVGGRFRRAGHGALLRSMWDLDRPGARLPAGGHTPPARVAPRWFSTSQAPVTTPAGAYRAPERDVWRSTGANRPLCSKRLQPPGRWSDTASDGEGTSALEDRTVA